MADLKQRLPQNVPGKFYVDTSCCDCDYCRAVAPEFFRRNDEMGASFVHQQPLSPEELKLAEEARDGCPTESIGNDGQK